MAYEREAQTDIAELQRLAAGRVETDPPSGYERDAQSDVMELGRLARDLSESNPAAGGYERVGQTDIAVLRRKLIGGGGAVVATGYSLSGPSSGNVGVPSTNFTVTLTPSGGTVIGTATITPSDGGGGGTFTPSTVGLTTASPSATFTYTPASAGTKTISTTNDKGLTNPTSLSYAATAVGLADGDPVSSWPDSSVNGNHATMTGSNRPTFKTAIVNGKPVVRFTAAGASKLNLTTPISGAVPWIVFAVVKTASIANRIASLVGNDTPGGASPYGPLIVAAGTNYFFTREGYMPNASGPVSSAFHIMEGIYAGVGGASHFIVIDGVNDSGAFNALPSTGNFITIGYDSLTPTYSDGDIAEIIIYAAAISGTDRVNIEKYLGTKYAITVPSGTAVQPDTVTGLVGWWKADSLLPPVAALTDGDPVSLWPDSNFRGHDATQSGSARPTFKTNIINGKPVVRFTSAGLSKLDFTPISGVTPFRLFAVMKQASAGSVMVALRGNGTAGFPMLIFNSDNNVFVADRTGYTSTSLGGGGGGPPTFGFHVLTSISTAGTLAVRVDGAGVITALNPLANSGNFATIGYDSVAPAYSDGDVAEVIIYNADLVAGDLVNIERYLGVKYGITVGAGTAVQPDTVAGLVAWWKADSL